MEASAQLEYLCNTLSLTVVVLCLVSKLPQIWSAFKSRDTTGISLSSVLLEEFGYSIMLSYNFAMGYPVATYFEYTFLVIQDLAMLSLIFYTREMLNIVVFLGFVLYMAAYMSIGYGLLPDTAMSCVISLCTPLGMISKSAQIVELYRKKDPGHLSTITWGIALYGCLVRLFTNIVQTGDVWIVINFTSGSILNITVVAMIIYYGKLKKQKLY